MIVVGRNRMVQYDDTASDEPVRVYDRGMDHGPTSSFGEHQLVYRTGDVVIPRVEPQEPLALELQDFANAIRTGEQPRSNVGAGSRHRRGGRDGTGLDDGQRRAARVRPLGRAGRRLNARETSPGDAVCVPGARVAGRPPRFVHVSVKGVIAVPPTAGPPGPWLGDTRESCLQMVANRPIISHVLSALGDSGVSEVAVLTPEAVAGGDLLVPAAGSSRRDHPRVPDPRVRGGTRRAGGLDRGRAGRRAPSRRPAGRTARAAGGGAARRVARGARAGAVGGPRQQAAGAGSRTVAPERRTAAAARHPRCGGSVPARPGRPGELGTLDGSVGPLRPGAAG